MEEIILFIGIIGFLAFGIGVIWLIASFFTKKGFKKPLITIGVGFVLFIVGVIMDPATEEQAEGSVEKSSEVLKVKSDEDSEAEAKKASEEQAEVIRKDEEAKATKENEEKEKAKAESESTAAEESKKES